MTITDLQTALLNQDSSNLFQLAQDVSLPNDIPGDIQKEEMVAIILDWVQSYTQQGMTIQARYEGVYPVYFS